MLEAEGKGKILDWRLRIYRLLLTAYGLPFTISSWVSASWAIAQAQFFPNFEIVFYWQLSFH
jgi:hypothetical protein